ncbi:MAG: hypothetical protein PHN49_12325 [Candidatus Omnitrophica bacterium]|nr:hypothetical protein [Candidatus Omnitrophota bacterium]MDD5672412.1 hypothetical protein [Candidatus Omnitrophota bacterium]
MEESKSSRRRFFPFTVVLLFALTVIAFLTETHIGRLSAGWLEHLGFAPQDLWRGHWERLLTSALVTESARAFWQAFLMIVLAVGTLEYAIGARLTAFMFWGFHLLTLLFVSLMVALPLHLFGFSTGTVLIVARDVGPSAGYFGCLGLAIWQWSKISKIAKLILTVSIGSGLLAVSSRTILFQNDQSILLIAGLSHVVAFFLGWLSLPLVRRWHSEASA